MVPKVPFNCLFILNPNNCGELFLGVHSGGISWWTFRETLWFLLGWIIWLSSAGLFSFLDRSDVDFVSLHEIGVRGGWMRGQNPVSAISRLPNHITKKVLQLMFLDLCSIEPLIKPQGFGPKSHISLFTKGLLNTRTEIYGFSTYKKVKKHCLNCYLSLVPDEEQSFNRVKLEGGYFWANLDDNWIVLILPASRKWTMCMYSNCRSQLLCKGVSHCIEYDII